MHMQTITHKTAKPSDYNKESAGYDAFNERNSALINFTITQLLKKNTVQTVLDLACGTGSQVFWLTREGFEVTGVDINTKMLKIAKQKAAQEKVNLTFFKGDMRTSQPGSFDAVITIFNSIGHLTKADFEIALRNIHRNLKKNGIYIFDIANLNYYRTGTRIAELTVDWFTHTDDTHFRDIQYATLDEQGILALHNICFLQKGNEKTKVSKSVKTLQIYSAADLKALLSKNSFKIIEQTGIDGQPFFENTTDRILIVAQKLPEPEL
jgi:2-polyprenyl-3-methyl-5-hydroxy-6-metoxy-1,4-benzoquinol methylase